MGPEFAAEPFIAQPGDALLIVGVTEANQALIPRATDVIAPINRAVALFTERMLPVYVSPPEVANGLSLPSTRREITPSDHHGSAFAGSDLTYFLQGYGITRLLLAGLSTEGAVIATARDGLSTGFVVHVLREGVRAQDLSPGAGASALDVMLQLGVKLTSSEALV